MFFSENNRGEYSSLAVWSHEGQQLLIDLSVQFRLDRNHIVGMDALRLSVRCARGLPLMLTACARAHHPVCRD